MDPSIIYLHWSLFFFWCIIIPQLKYHFLNLNLYILDEPDVQAEKSWIHADVGVEVEISCTIYAEPTAEVSNDQAVTNVLQMYIFHENIMILYLTSFFKIEVLIANQAVDLCKIQIEVDQVLLPTWVSWIQCRQAHDCNIWLFYLNGDLSKDIL